MQKLFNNILLASSSPPKLSFSAFEVKPNEFEDACRHGNLFACWALVPSNAGSTRARQHSSQNSVIDVMDFVV